MDLHRQFLDECLESHEAKVREDTGTLDPLTRMSSLNPDRMLEIAHVGACGHQEAMDLRAEQINVSRTAANTYSHDSARRQKARPHVEAKTGASRVSRTCRLVANV